MVKISPKAAGFVALPLALPSALNPANTVRHYVYLKLHDPKVADEDAHRSLFLVNVPVTTTEADLRHLFTTQLEGGRVEHVYFPEDVSGRAFIADNTPTRSSRKRKRMTAEEIEAGLDQHNLPEVTQSEVHSSGATAIVVFIDRPSMELSLKAARRAAHLSQAIVWRKGIDTQSQFGLRRYESFNTLCYPSRRELLRSVDGYMSAYAQMEEARARETARKRQMPDEDGFVTVTRGPKAVKPTGELKEDTDKKEKGRVPEDFYRFQMREKRKGQHEDMLRRFEDDKRKVEEMMQQRRR